MKLKSIITKPAALSLALIMLITLIPINVVETKAAANIPTSVFLKQVGTRTCTLSSAAMMLRGRAYLSGYDRWNTITEESIKSIAWSSGLKGSWTYSFDKNSISVARSSMSGVSVNELKGILDSHPEGVVLYCGKKPHAVYVTDYSGNTFYCADPLSSYSLKRLTLASSYLGKVYGTQNKVLDNTTAYWYVTKYSITNSNASTFSNPDNPIVFFQSMNYEKYKKYDRNTKEWAKYSYGYYDVEETKKATISSSGCGIVSFTNMVYYMTGQFIHPITLADYALTHKRWSENKLIRSSGEGTNADILRCFCRDYGSTYGLAYVGFTSNFKILQGYLNNGFTAQLRGNGHHVMCVVAYRKSDDKYLILDSAPNCGFGIGGHTGYAWKSEDQVKKLGGNFYVIKSTKDINISITANAVTASKTTNTSTQFNVGISPKANIKTVGIFYGTNQSAVNNININTEHKNGSGYEYKQLWATSTDYKNISSYSFDTAKSTTMQGKWIKFNPSTKYYYKFVVRLANGNWYISGINNFTTKGNKPAAVTNIMFDRSDGTYATDADAVISWKQSADADKYKVYFYDPAGNEIWRNEDTKSLSLNTGKMTKPGNYTVNIYAANSAGASAVASKTLTVREDVKVTFDFADSSSSAQVKNVKYGASFNTLPAPSRVGYTFAGWQLKGSSTVASENTKVNNITSDTVYVAQWKANKYTVSFVDGYDNSTIFEDEYYYGTELSETDPAAIYPNAPEHAHYRFNGWSESSYTVEAEPHTIYARYEWDLPSDIGTEIINVVRAKSKASVTVNDGYNVTVKITAPKGLSQTIKGRVIVALKTAKGRLLLETESSAFVLYPSNTSTTSKTIEVFVPYEATNEDLAAITEAYVVNNYSSAGIISNVDVDSVHTTAANADEWQYTSVKPVIGQNGVVALDPSLDYVTYDLITATTTDSLAISLPGYTLDSSAWVKVNGGTIYYAKSWPRIGNTAGQKSKGTSGSQFNNTTAVGKYLYNKYNNTPMKASETATSKITVNNVGDGAIYYHWCCNRNNGTLDHNVTGSKWYADTTTGNKYYTFHAFWWSAEDDAAYSNYVYDSYLEDSFYKRNLSSKNSNEFRDQCKDSYYWATRLPVYKQTWEQFTKKFTYSKTETTSEQKAASISDIPNYSPETSKETINGVTLTTTVKKSTANVQNWYAYKTGVSVNHEDKNIYDINVELGKEYIGKEATVYVYKNNQVSDSTTEFIGTSAVNSEGKIVIQDVQLREPCTEKTGDLTIAVAMPGETNAIIAGKIEAPKPEYTVTFHAGDNIISTQKIVKGGSAELPDESLIPDKEGYHFKGWNQSVVNINGNLNVIAEYEEDEYSVVFVDWNNQNIEIKKYSYGDAISAPDLPETADDTEVEWMLFDNEKGVTQSLNNFISDGGVVTSDMIIVADYSIAKVELTLLHPEKTAPVQMRLMAAKSENTVTSGAMAELTREDINRYSTETISLEYADLIQLEEYEQTYSDNVEILGWKKITDGTAEYLEDNTITSDMVIYPVYLFNETTEQPEADIDTGEYNSAQTVTLSCETPGADIWYTTDGSDPTTSETAVQYSEPFVLNQTTELTFYAIAPGMNQSGYNYRKYAINENASGADYHLVTIFSNLFEGEGGYLDQYLAAAGSTIDDSEYPETEEYEYLGLFYDEQGIEEFDVSRNTVDGRLVLYALYDLGSFEVKFVNEDGVTPIGTTQSVRFGENAVAPEAPEKKDWEFAGWEPAELDNIVEDTVFVAQYVPKYVEELTGHALTRIEAVPATCTSPGNEEYYICNECSKYYRDASDLTEIKEGDWIVPATGHLPAEPVRENEIAATCTAEGRYDSVVYCSVCGEEVSRSQGVISKLKHTPAVDAAVAATCTEPGLTEGSHCSVCGETIKEQIQTPAKGHNWGEWVVQKEATETETGLEIRTCKTDTSHTETREIPVLTHEHSLEKVDARAATCMESGNIEHWICEGCGRLFTDETGATEITDADVIIAAIGHQPEKPVRENIVEATVESEGSYDEVVYCSVCKEELSRKTVSIPKLQNPAEPEIKDNPKEQQETPSEATKPADRTEEKEQPPTAVKPTDTSGQQGNAVSGSSEPAVTPTPSVGAQFTDVTEKTVVPTSLKAINWAVDNGIVKGYSDNTFKPETICTREQFTIMLWRFAGEPASNASAVNKFTDVSDFSNNTSKKAVAWAVEQGVIKGFSDGSFQPKEDITRAQVAVMLWRFAGEKSVSANSKFSDISSYSSSVQNAIIWEESAGVASGYKDGTFKPDDGCQRQHMAIFLYRFNSKVDQYKPQG